MVGLTLREDWYGPDEGVDTDVVAAGNGLIGRGVNEWDRMYQGVS